MSSKQEAVYIMCDEDEEEWVSPTPASVAIVRTITANTPLNEDEIGSVDEYVDLDGLYALLQGDDSGELNFTVEGYGVTVDDGGNIELIS